MTGFPAALYAELLKAVRSRVPWITAAGFSLAPIAGGLFMIILKDPEQARRLGIIGAKAQFVGGTADWPSFFGLIAQATAVGGMLVFAFVASWVFGREPADGTTKNLLALPTPREAIVAAKFVVIGLWVGILTALIYALALAIGAAVGLPLFSPALLWRSAIQIFAAAGLTLALMPAVSFLASAGRGYLAPLGFAALTLFLSQILAALGWGAYFPWSVPAVYSGVAGEQGGTIVGASYAVVVVTCLLGIAATLVWWRWADQAK